MRLTGTRSARCPEDSGETGRPEIAAVCEGILREEEEMARFLESQLPGTVRIALRQAD